MRRFPIFEAVYFRYKVRPEVRASETSWLVILSRSHQLCLESWVAQLVARKTVNLKVHGSSPCLGALFAFFFFVSFFHLPLTARVVFVLKGKVYELHPL